jgi:hypothetical protein
VGGLIIIDAPPRQLHIGLSHFGSVVIAAKSCMRWH